MGAALADDEAPDGCPTDRARLSLPIIHPEIILEISAAIDPIKAGPVAEDAFLQGGLDGGMELLGLPGTDRIRQY